MKITPEALAFACQRIEDFRSVQRRSEEKERMAALDIVLNSLGLDEDCREQFADWCDDFNGPGWEGAVFMGVLIGLFAAEYGE